MADPVDDPSEWTVPVLPGQERDLRLVPNSDDGDARAELLDVCRYIEAVRLKLQGQSKPRGSVGAEIDNAQTELLQRLIGDLLVGCHRRER